MCKNKLAAVVIPMYKERLTDLEKISFHQCLCALKRYDIILVVPDKLSVQFFDDSKIHGIEQFDNAYFESVETYNCLMLTKEFYERFSIYKYILIYQLDAFVFSDQLEYFCNMDYDYIGAPWLYGMFRFVDCEHNVWYVGNGGFSLRKTESFIKILDERSHLVSCNKEAEDVFFASMSDSNFKVAPLEVAMQFSIETDVRKCYEKNNEHLPFGCHAWERYDIDFWKPYIEKCGYCIPVEYLLKGKEDFADTMIEIRKKCKEKEFYWKKVFKKENFSNYFKNQYSSKSEKFVIWGAGHWGQIMYRLLIDVGISVETIIDRKKSPDYETMEGCPIITPEEYRDLGVHSNILVAVWKDDEDIHKSLGAMGYSYGNDYICVKDIESYIEYL